MTSRICPPINDYALDVAKWNFNVQITNSYYEDNSTGFGASGMIFFILN